MSAGRRLAVIVNPTAGRGRALATLRAACAELDRIGADYRVEESKGLDHARGAAEAAIAARETVVAVGGDGLVACLASVLCGSPGALAVVPAGRGNDFARAIGVPSEPAAAARVAVEGRERLIDVGEVDGKPFLCIASVGFDSDVNRLAAGARLARGRLAYVYAALRALAGWKHATFEVRVDGRAQTFAGYSVAVANTGVYGGGMKLAPHARLEDGLLDVVTVATAGKLDFLMTFSKVFRGRHVAHPAIGFQTAETVALDAERPFDVYADGEPIGRLPVTVRVRPRALRVIAPVGAA